MGGCGALGVCIRGQSANTRTGSRSELAVQEDSRAQRLVVSRNPYLLVLVLCLQPALDYSVQPGHVRLVRKRDAWRVRTEHTDDLAEHAERLRDCMEGNHSHRQRVVGVGLTTGVPKCVLTVQCGWLYSYQFYSTGRRRGRRWVG